MKDGAVKEKKGKHISEQPVTLKNWYKHIDWVNVTFVAIIPFFGLIAAFSTPLLWRTATWTLFYYFLTGLGITAGISDSHLTLKKKES